MNILLMQQRDRHDPLADPLRSDIEALAEAHVAIYLHEDGDITVVKDLHNDVTVRYI